MSTWRPGLPTPTCLPCHPCRPCCKRCSLHAVHDVAVFPVVDSAAGFSHRECHNTARKSVQKEVRPSHRRDTAREGFVWRRDVHDTRAVAHRTRHHQRARAPFMRPHGRASEHVTISHAQHFAEAPYRMVCMLDWHQHAWRRADVNHRNSPLLVEDHQHWILFAAHSQSAVGGHTTPPKAAAPWADLQRLCTRLPCCAEHPSPPAA